MDKYSLDPLPPNIKQGLIAISTLAMISIVTTGGAIMFIVMRLFDKHNYQSAPLRFNQSIILILNLLLADFQQALSFVLSIHWVTKNAILAPTTACNVQAWMVQMGDVSSGLFSLAIAMQTFYIIVMQRNLPYKVFVSCVVGIWVVCITMSIISPIAHRNKHLYVSTGAWCWIADNYREERLFVHYIWIFICEFGSFFLYAIIFVFLRRNITHNSAGGVQNRSIQRVARLMLVYPIAYTCLTLPLASYRMASQSGNEPSQSILIFAGSFMASCGWVDVLIYLATRRTILTLQNSSLASADRSKNGDINGIPMNNTISGSQIRNSVRPNMATSVASSQEGFVKMEHVVEVTVESAIPIEQVITGEEGEEQHQQKPMGNSTTVSGTHYWA